MENPQESDIPQTPIVDVPKRSKQKTLWIIVTVVFVVLVLGAAMILLHNNVRHTDSSTLTKVASKRTIWKVYENKDYTLTYPQSWTVTELPKPPSPQYDTTTWSSDTKFTSPDNTQSFEIYAYFPLNAQTNGGKIFKTQQLTIDGKTITEVYGNANTMITGLSSSKNWLAISVKATSTTSDFSQINKVLTSFKFVDTKLSEANGFPIYPNVILEDKQWPIKCNIYAVNTTCGKALYTWQTADDFNQVTNWYTNDKSNSGWKCSQGAGMYDNPRSASSTRHCTMAPFSYQLVINAEGAKTELILEVPYNPTPK